MGQISDLTALTAPATGDLLLVRDVSDPTDKDKKIALSEFGVLDLAATWNAKQTFGAGISLGDETLSVYDEGTWTPNDGSGAGLSFSSVAGRYTRIGRMVFAEFSVTFPTTANTSGAAIGNLPFTPLNLISTTRGGGFLMGITAGLSFVTVLVTASSTVQFMDGSFAAYTNANFSGKVVRATVIYTV
jgi:hypothetical protein